MSLRGPLCVGVVFYKTLVSATDKTQSEKAGQTKTFKIKRGVFCFSLQLNLGTECS